MHEKDDYPEECAVGQKLEGTGLAPKGNAGDLTPATKPRQPRPEASMHLLKADCARPTGLTLARRDD